ncbi:MAG: pyridoxal phosphate-dependent decarboxylase family protein [Marinilabiliaceae bacterium]
MNDTNLLNESFQKIKEYLQHRDNDQHTVKYREPHELTEKIDFQVASTGTSEKEFLRLIDQYLEFSVRTGDKQFINQLYSGFNLPAFIGEMLTVATNTSMSTYEVAPVATLIEKEMIGLMNSYAGYRDGEGIFVSGGSNGNLIAMFSARNQVLPDNRFAGYDRGQKLKAFANDQAHYSFDTAANLLGIGADNVVKIKSDENGKMVPSDLEKKIIRSLEKGEKPFFVVATCATTLLAAYDPVDEIADICDRHHIWLHADGAFGGSLLLSDRHRHLMKGLERTDSFVWDPHKIMNIPLICSALLIKKKGTLKHNITDINTDYLYHQLDDNEDLGEKSIQCGRRVDAVKLWFAWKYFGLEGYQKRIDNLIDMAKYAEAQVNSNPSLELLVPRQSFAVCFRYKPAYNANLNAFNLELREALRKKGKTLVNFSHIGQTLAIRFVATNGDLKEHDLDQFFENLLSEARKLEHSNYAKNE